MPRGIRATWFRTTVHGQGWGGQAASCTPAYRPGSPLPEFHRQCALRRGGEATVLGIYEQPQITFDASLLISRELTVRGVQGYCRDFPAALSMARELPMERLVTHVFPLEELPLALETALDRTKGSIKIILHP